MIKDKVKNFHFGYDSKDDAEEDLLEFLSEPIESWCVKKQHGSIFMQKNIYTSIICFEYIFKINLFINKSQIIKYYLIFLIPEVNKETEGNAFTTLKNLYLQASE